jgi:hypothetical protein
MYEQAKNALKRARYARQKQEQEQGQDVIPTAEQSPTTSSLSLDEQLLEEAGLTWSQLAAFKHEVNTKVKRFSSYIPNK